MNVTRYEAVGIFISVALMSLSLFLMNMEEATSRLNPNISQPATVLLSDDNPVANVSDAMNASGDLEQLIIDDVVLGSGDPVESGDTVSVHYIGTLTNGTAFDNSYLRETPFEFTIGEGTVIPGWEQGIIGMRAGGQRILVVPADLAYGSAVVGSIPANSDLVFAIELLEIK